MKFLEERVRAFLLTLLDALRENYFYHSGALTFHLLLSLAPLTVVLLSFADLLPFLSIERIESAVEKLFPRHASDILHEILEVRRGRTGTSLMAFFVSYVFSVGFIRSMAKALSSVSEGVFGERREFLYWLLMPLFLLGGALILLTGFALSLYLKFALPGSHRLVVELAYVLPGALLILLLYLGFLRRRVSLLRLICVSLLTSFSLFLLQFLFTLYITHIFRGNLLYGSLGSLIIFLLWTNLVFFLFLLGARLIYRLESRETPSGGVS